MLRCAIPLASIGYPPSQDTAMLVQVYPEKRHQGKQELTPHCSLAW
jgi:hypothetical protein